ncbi:MAG: serine/threonine-protein kinase [Bryobacteraceae bacterium]
MGPANRKLGRFEILEKLGRGGMADVYLARDPDSGERVALKVIEHSCDADTRDSIDAERRGAALQARLAAIDPHVVKIYETDDADGYFFVSMEYVEGEDLSAAIKRGPLPPLRAAEIASAICETLDHSHTLDVQVDGKDYHGVVHGDIKPRNIRVEPGGGVRVLDFGIAKALSLSRRLTRNEFGSVPYASPERLDTGDVDQHSDLWSLGVVLYEMLAGTQPFQSETTEKLERMIRSREAPPPLPGHCPSELRRIVAKALAPEAAQRYASARELCMDLAAVREGRAVGASGDDLDATRRTTRREEDDAADTRRTTRPAAAPPRTPAGPARRNLRRAIGYLFLGFLLYMVYEAATGYLLWRRGREFARRVEAEELTGPDQIWAAWDELSKGHSTSLLLYSPRHSVKSRLMGAADRVITAYRAGEGQTVYENDWRRARTYLARALLLNPGDDEIRGRLRLCEGHIARITGTVKRNAAVLNEAVQKFNEAQQLMRRSPDPQLGLARVYVYGLRDIDKAYEALQQAERRGHRLGNREKAQLADGYRDRADRLWWDSRNIRDLPQEEDQIKRAADDYRRALDMYQSIAPYGDATASIVRVQNSLVEVETRLEAIRNPQPAPAPEGAAALWR